VSAGGDARRRIIDLVTRKVRPRFHLAPEAFADRLVDSGRALGLDGEGLLAHVGRLSLDDLYLATACVGGEEEAWEECASRHFAFVRDFARRYLRDPEARDVADEVIADLWRRGKIGRFDGRSTLRTWLGAVVAHAALNALKASRPRVSLEGDEFESWRGRNEPREAPRPAEEESRAVLRQLVSEALRGMPGEGRLLLLLHYEQGLSLDAMSVVIGASKSTMSRRLKSTCADLRAAVEGLARARFGESADALRAGVDLGDLDLDLPALVGGTPARDGDAAAESKQWKGEKTAT
jgi:RNA polymerase sigma factor (sigma-70 family)